MYGPFNAIQVLYCCIILYEQNRRTCSPTIMIPMHLKPVKPNKMLIEEKKKVDTNFCYYVLRST